MRLLVAMAKTLTLFAIAGFLALLVFGVTVAAESMGFFYPVILLGLFFFVSVTAFVYYVEL